MSRLRQRPVRAWQRMLSGRRLDLLDPSPLDIEIEDIAHGLARVARWNGQTRGDHAFSVAQHSLVVEAIVANVEPDPRWRLAALLHDGPEYVIGDMISPFKGVMGGDYKAVEKRLQTAIHLRFGLPAELPAAVEKLIKSADRLSAFHEATLLAGFSKAEAVTYFGAPTDAAVDLGAFVPVPPTVVGPDYLARFAELDQLLHGSQPRPQRAVS
ncbi:HD family hydrolase [Mangrovicella endophytica]|uniref:HD family hydrolase n=1 Tax=Mangrovicella endophytica TaxID=2066697 RepID=UPI000C9E1198|nr:HD family hydrolase [Mangrovicella endophytica]